MYSIPNTLFIGKELVYLQEIDSTNSYLKNLLQTQGKQKEGLLVIANEQTAGRGQSTNTWISEQGQNITTSILFHPHFLEPRQIFYFNKAVALAVRECIDLVANKNEAAHHRVSIKWPNDILIGTKKVAGILIENSFRSNTIEYAISGIGINVNQKFRNIGAFNAISLSDICEKDIDLQEVINLLCGMLEKYYLILKRFDLNKIDASYKKYLFGIGVERQFIFNGKYIYGIVSGVNENGLLLIAIEGELKEFRLKEIEWVI